jgi:hypothetical protein
MARKVPLEDLQAREAHAKLRLARERRTLARLQKQTAQAEAAARCARLCALGEAVEAVLGDITPEGLKDVLRPLEPVALPVPQKDMRDTAFPQRETPQPSEVSPHVSDLRTEPCRLQAASRVTENV